MIVLRHPCLPSNKKQGKTHPTKTKIGSKSRKHMWDVSKFKSPSHRGTCGMFQNLDWRWRVCKKTFSLYLRSEHAYIHTEAFTALLYGCVFSYPTAC